jgi:hypothetical protein
MRLSSSSALFPKCPSLESSLSSALVNQGGSSFNAASPLKVKAISTRRNAGTRSNQPSHFSNQPVWQLSERHRRQNGHYQFMRWLVQQTEAFPVFGPGLDGGPCELLCSFGESDAFPHYPGIRSDTPRKRRTDGPKESKARL